jgi:hypothetical protein
MTTEFVREEARSLRETMPVAGVRVNTTGLKKVCTGMEDSDV